MRTKTKKRRPKKHENWHIS